MFVHPCGSDWRTIDLLGSEAALSLLHCDTKLEIHDEDQFQEVQSCPLGCDSINFSLSVLAQQCCFPVFAFVSEEYVCDECRLHLWHFFACDCGRCNAVNTCLCTCSQMFPELSFVSNSTDGQVSCIKGVATSITQYLMVATAFSLPRCLSRAQEVELIPRGATQRVTLANRQDYFDRVVRYHLNEFNLQVRFYV